MKILLYVLSVSAFLIIYSCAWEPNATLIARDQLKHAKQVSIEDNVRSKEITGLQAGDISASLVLDK